MPVLKLTGLFLVAAVTTGTAAEKPYNYVPSAGVVPNAAIAVKIAMAVLVPIYGQRQIADELPLIAKLNGGIWTVEGTFHHPGWNGGVALIEIAKSDGRVVRISRGK